MNTSTRQDFIFQFVPWSDPCTGTIRFDFHPFYTYENTHMPHDGPIVTTTTHDQ
jgi:hypothetical protein